MTIFTTARVVVAAAEVPIVATIVSLAAAGIAVAAVVIAVTTPVVPVVVIAPRVSTPASVVAVSTTAVIAVVPGASTDKDTADERLWTVEAIRCAFVRVVAVVSVRTNGCYADVARSNSNVNGDLSLRVTCGKHEDAK
jgi:uncharacterized membrane protein